MLGDRVQFVEIVLLVLLECDFQHLFQLRFQKCLLVQIAHCFSLALRIHLSELLTSGLLG